MARDKRPVEQTVKQTKEPRRPDFENTLHIITSRLDRWPVIPDELEWAIKLTQKEEELAMVQMIGIVKGDIRNAKWKAREKKNEEQRQQEGVGMPQPSRQKGTEKQTGLKHDEELEPQQAKSFEGKGKKRARGPEPELQQPKRFKCKCKGKGKEPAEAPFLKSDLDPLIKWPTKLTIINRAPGEKRKAKPNVYLPKSEGESEPDPDPSVKWPSKLTLVNRAPGEERKLKLKIPLP
ncbi:hypothetical protein CFE70_007080 [Pyrenophora teres f. teres 0-1]